MTDEIACTCKCAPEEHGPHGCKTWYGDRNTGFACNCDWRLWKAPYAYSPMPPHLHRMNTANMTCWDCGIALTNVKTPETCPVRAAQEKTPRDPDRPCEREHPELITLCAGLRELSVPCDGFTPAADALGAIRRASLRSTHQDRLALDCGRLIIEKLLEWLPARELFDNRPSWSQEEFRQEIAQIILKNGFEKL